MMSNEYFVPNNKEAMLWEKIFNCFRSSYLHKESLGMTSLWQTCEQYWSGEVNLSESEEDPGSQTNIIQPIIESQVADLVDGTMDFTIRGSEPTDAPYADKVRHIFKWAWYHNDMITTLDASERERTNYGTTAFRVGYDPDAFGGKGKPTIDHVGIEEIFPDPKIKDPKNINDGDFFIRAMPYTLSALVRKFGDKARSVKPEGSFTYDPRIFKDQDDTSGIDDIIRSQCLLLEYWEIDDEGLLRRVYAAGGVILEDSFDEEEHKGFYAHGKYPYIIIPCYKRKGRVWGSGDTEQLIPIQDMINDLDDQIRINARMMGNLQIVVGTQAGINLRKWVNVAGLKIPAKDPNAWRPVIPPPIPAYIPQRRSEGFKEAEIVSGRSDVVEGRRSGSLRSAAAIAQMQDAGARRARHKKLMLQEGLRQVMNLVYEYIVEFMDVERAFDFEDTMNPETLWFKGTELNELPIQTLNENFDATRGEPGTDMYKDLLDENGEPMTRKGEFIIMINFGTGMPNTPSFVYESTIEMHRENLITQEEARAALKTVLNYPIIDPYNPQGKFIGRNNSAEQLAMANNMAIPGQEQMPEQIPGQMQMPEVQQQGMDPLAMLEMAIQQLPPEVLQQILGGIGGGESGNPELF